MAIMTVCNVTQYPRRRGELVTGLEYAGSAPWPIETCLRTMANAGYRELTREEIDGTAYLVAARDEVRVFAGRDALNTHDCIVFVRPDGEE